VRLLEEVDVHVLLSGLASTMSTPSLGTIVVASLIGGMVVAAGLVTGPFAGAAAHVITGVTLLALARRQISSRSRSARGDSRQGI